MRNAYLDDLKDQQYAEAVREERKEVYAMTDIETTAHTLANQIRIRIQELYGAHDCLEKDNFYEIAQQALTAAEQRGYTNGVSECLKVPREWLSSFEMQDIKYSSPREYAVSAVKDIEDSIHELSQTTLPTPEGI